MSFKENLQQKARVDRLAENVISSIGPVSGGYHINKTDMRRLVEIAGYQLQTRRGIEMYAKDFSRQKAPIVVLDNELKMYDTISEDIAVRKNPTLGEMVKFKNIRKILNDNDVVISCRGETVKAIRREILENIDLTFTDKDIDELYREGIEAIEKYTPEKVVATLDIFAEILGLHPPDTLFSSDLAVYGHTKETGGDLKYGPVYIYSHSRNTLGRYNVVFPAADSKNPASYKALLSAGKEPDAQGTEVFDDLREKATAMPEKRLMLD